MFDLPVEYKNLKLYPITMMDYFEFAYYSDCLMLEKNSISNPELAIKTISMSYLEYLFFSNTDENRLLEKMVNLFRLVLKRDDTFEIRYIFDKNGKPLLIIDNYTYNSQDFDELKTLIAEQNDLDLPNEKIQKSVREKLEEARKFKQKINGSKLASLEEQMIALSLFSGISMSEVYKMTIRKFFLSIKRANHMVMSNIYLTASMSGFVSFKDKSILKGWLADITVEDKYADVKVDPDALQKKINFEDAKEK